MLLLIHANRNQVCLIQQNIRCHKNRICVESRIDIIRVFCGFILKLGHAVQLTHIGKAVQDPAEFRVCGDM